MKKIKILKPAQIEFHESILWYANQSKSAARRFAHEVRTFIKRIEAKPDQFAYYDDQFREAILLIYPFSIYYYIDPQGIPVVVAIANAHRDRGYWLNRVNLN